MVNKIYWYVWAEYLIVPLRPVGLIDMFVKFTDSMTQEDVQRYKGVDTLSGGFHATLVIILQNYLSWAIGLNILFKVGKMLRYSHRAVQNDK